MSRIEELIVAMCSNGAEYVVRASDGPRTVHEPVVLPLPELPAPRCLVARLAHRTGSPA